jgi:hypothetical protein
MGQNLTMKVSNDERVGVMKMRKMGLPGMTLLLVAVMLPGRAAGQTELNGGWAGAITLPGGAGALEIAVTFSAAPSLSAKMDVPSQGATGIPLTQVSYSAPEVSFVMTTASGPGTFEGRLDGNVIEGSFRQGPAEMPFRLERGAAISTPAAPKLFAEAPDHLHALHVGDPEVDGTRIEPYETEFNLVRRAPDGTEKPFGRWTDRLERVTRGDRVILRREVARYTAAGVMDLWRVHTVDARTMAPLVVDQRFGPDMRSVMRLEIEGEKVRQTVVGEADKPASVRELELSEAPFDLSLWAVLLTSFPRTNGQSASFPVLGPGGVLGWETYTVEDGGEVALPSGEAVSTQEVSTRFRPWTVWLADEAPYIVKIVQRLPDGSEVISTRAHG